MRSAFKIFSVLILLAIYLLGAAGFGVHECRSRGSVDILPLVYAEGCDKIHNDNSEEGVCTKDCCSHRKSSGEKHSESSHTDECCTTEIHHLGSDYESVNSRTTTIEKSVQIILLSLSSTFEYLTDLFLPESHLTEVNGESPPLLRFRTYSYLSQWRL